MSTRPDYPQSGYEGTTEGKKFVANERKADAQEQMQGLADAYQPGRKSTGGPTQKAKAKAFDKTKDLTTQLAAGEISTEEYLEKAKSMGLIG